MPLNNHFQIIGFHGCDKKLGIDVINGKATLKPSRNNWDWLGKGIYFWELNPAMALDYAIRSAQGIQFNKIPIKTPFVIGAIIELGNCLNLTQMDHIPVLSLAYNDIMNFFISRGTPVPTNDNDNRKLDCAVFNHIHASREQNKLAPFDTVRCGFEEGAPIYNGCRISSKAHIQVSVLNPEMIIGYFLPLPIEKYNPYLKNDFH